jgi:hypothetical protein
MTIQISEILIYNGEEYQLKSVPLEPYLEKHNIILGATNSDCWRGYIGHWLIEDGYLYLTNLSANLAINNNSRWRSEKVGMDYLFPGKNKVLAEWFSGELHIPYGKMIPSTVWFYDYFYEKELVFDFVNGKCVNSHEIDNVKLYDERLKLAEKRRLEKGI